MRVGLFSDTFTPEVNGVVSSVTMLAEGLRARGHEVWVIAPAHPDAPADEAQTLRIPSVPFLMLRERRFATPVELGLMRRIADLQLDIIHTNAEFAVNSFGFRAHRRFKIAQLHTYHTVWEEYTHYVAPGVFGRPARAAARRLSAEICNKADRVIAPTEKTATLLSSYGVTKPIDIVPTGVDLARFSPANEADTAQAARLTALRERWGLTRFGVTLLALGRVAPEKSILELLLLLAPWLRERADACLLIVGGGPQLRELQRLTPSLGIGEQVVFTGEQLWDDVPDYYRISDMLVGNSSTETQGLTFIEALASGVPLVVRNNACFEGIIEDGVSGTLIEDEGEFVPALNALLDDDILRAQRVASGRATAQRLSKETFAQTIEAAYRKTLDDLGKYSHD